MKTPALILVSLMACSAIGTSTARAQAYIVRDLGVVEDMAASEATAVNSEGYVAGIAYNDTASCAFQYSKKLMQDAGGVNSRGFAINSAKLVVGDAYFTQNIKYTSHAVIFKGGEVRDLGVLEGQMYSRANGINAVGWVVGSSGPERDSTASRAFIWTQPTGMFDIGTLGGLYAQAYAINDWGYVTGTSTRDGRWDSCVSPSALFSDREIQRTHERFGHAYGTDGIQLRNGDQQQQPRRRLLHLS